MSNPDSTTEVHANRQAAPSDLLERRAHLVKEIKQWDGKLATIRNLIRSSGRMPASKYKQCCDSQTLYVREKGLVEAELASINSELRNRAEEKYDAACARRDSNGDTSPFVRSLSELRQRYQEFSADRTRVSSMRQMASQFVLELNPIIRAAIAQALSEKKGKPVSSDSNSIGNSVEAKP